MSKSISYLIPAHNPPHLPPPHHPPKNKIYIYDFDHLVEEEGSSWFDWSAVMQW